jgi:hypothetical protein
MFWLNDFNINVISQTSPFNILNSSSLTAWNTVTYCPKLKLNLCLMPWPYAPAPVTSFVLHPSVYQMSLPPPTGWGGVKPLLSGNLTVNGLWNTCLGIILSVPINKMGSFVSRTFIARPLHHYEDQPVNAVYAENHTKPLMQNEELLIV